MHADRLSLGSVYRPSFLRMPPSYLKSLATVSGGLCKCWAVAIRFMRVSALLLSGSWGGEEGKGL